ncbi:IS4 family transposase [Paenibacillus aquistagni]|uniref:IS4 family transposase n=1 Tax=Paenibacillus aquistagni TaxID=1852522 RepID=UPI001F116754|nr:IS4 family transposase [Paenibacillus aquistagni]
MKKFQQALGISSISAAQLSRKNNKLEPGTVYPDEEVITPAKPADHTQMDVLIDEADATYLMNRGYLDYRKYDDYCELGIHFVSRLKDNAIIEEVCELPKLEGKKIIRDVKVILGKDKKRMKNALHMIETIDSRGKPVRIITNRFGLTAEEIGEMYRSRWQIVICFRWVKQNLKFTRFYGEEENAVMNQIWICLIAYCLLLLMKLELSTDRTLTKLIDSLKTLLWKPWAKLVAALNWKPSRTSNGRQKSISRFDAVEQN